MALRTGTYDSSDFDRLADITASPMEVGLDNLLPLFQAELAAHNELAGRIFWVQANFINFDTNWLATEVGALMERIASLAEFERDLIRERTNAGLEAARARGRIGGRPPLLSGDKLRTARQLEARLPLTALVDQFYADVQRAVAYVNDNPPKLGLPHQRWSGLLHFTPR